MRVIINPFTGCLEPIKGKIRPSALAGEAISKGDLLYFSSNDEVSIMDITVANNAAGIALNDSLSGQEVIYVRWDDVCHGVLTGATAGDIYYWSNSGLTSTIPSVNGSYVWRVGTAKNATDLLVGVEYIKRNAGS